MAHLLLLPSSMFNMGNGQWCILFSVWVSFDFLCHISYRFRLVSISCDPGFVFSIDSHNLTVIEVEGTNTQPLLIDSLLILAGASVNYCKLLVIVLIDAKTGQRYSVVVCPFCSLFKVFIGKRISSIRSSMPACLWIIIVSFSSRRYFLIVTKYNQGFVLSQMVLVLLAGISAT